MNGNINQKILKQIFSRTKDDEPLKEFLKEILFLEAKKGKGWWFKKPYKQKIQEYSEEWGDE